MKRSDIRDTSGIRGLAAGWLLLGVGLLAGCAPSRLAVRPVAYDVDVRLDPVEHTLDGRTRLELKRLETERAAQRRAALDLQLHPELVVESIEVDGAELRTHRPRAGRADDETEIAPTRHRLVLERPGDTIRLTLGYRGRLYDDVAAGEKEGQVHNFAVAAHVAEEGVYLGEDGYWYPVVEFPEDAGPELKLADYRLAIDPIEGFEMVAGLERADDPDDGRLRWRSPFPLEGMVLLGGPLRRWSGSHGGIELHAVLDPEKQQVADDILAAAREYLERYEPLIGPYPFDEFTVLEAFFSSGFAFPTCTQIVGSQLSERKQYRRHGYLDHELLHNWWGNGVFVDPRDGNWCEGLASYLGNYYGHVLDGDAEGARKQRRNYSNFLSSLEPEADKPLGTFGLDDGAGRGVGYQKGAAVFHMLERRIGADAFFAGLRRVTAERMGRPTTWQHLQEAFEQESGEQLEPFFRQWVRGGGAPLLELSGAEWQPGSDELKVTVSQSGTSFVLDVPLRLHYGERFEDVVITVDGPTVETTVPCERSGLTAVELDPDYHVFRKLKPAETMPTASLTRRGPRLLIVVPEGELSQEYGVVADGFSRAVLGEEDEPKHGHEVVRRSSADVSPAELADADVLILGDAVRHPTVAAFLGRTRAPVVWADDGFGIEDAKYSGPGQAVFFTVHHPDRDDDGVTVYYGNDTAALANARLLTYYPNSLLVFETSIGEEPKEAPHSGMSPTRVVRRIDFEFHDRVDF